ncbi:MAG: gene transfer agent family protein [Cypionkella sp.]
MTRAHAAEGGSAPGTAHAAEGGSANRLRGEASFAVGGAARTLRPTFAALVAAEEELGPLFALVERAGAGELRLAEMAALFWHCLEQRDGLTREAVGEAVVAHGLAACAIPLRALLGAILQGRG